MTDPRRARILLIEDDPDDVWVMRNLLGDRWDGPYELIQVELLSAGIQRCRKGSHEKLRFGVRPEIVSAQTSAAGMQR